MGEYKKCQFYLWIQCQSDSCLPETSPGGGIAPSRITQLARQFLRLNATPFLNQLWLTASVNLKMVKRKKVKCLNHYANMNVAELPASCEM